MSDTDLIIALGQKWRRMSDDDKNLAVGLALDVLLQEYHGFESVYDWLQIRKELTESARTRLSKR